MRIRDRRSCAAGVAVLVLLALGLQGCSKKPTTVRLPNQKPTVRLTHAPVSTGDRYHYAYRMNWVGHDSDGKVAHFLYAVDPADLNVVDSSWVQTPNNEEIIFFRSSTPDSEGTPRQATDYHVFAIRAVDDAGEASDVVSRAFFSYTVAPTVFITEPTIGVFTPQVTPSVRIKWRGIDPDGVFTTKPVKYKFKLFRKVNPDFPAIQPDFIAFALTDPDEFRKLYEPTFFGWSSSNAETTEVQYTNLLPNESYMFVVTGFDEAGAYDPIFTPTGNMLRLAVTFAGTLGPKIRMFNEFFNYAYATGGYSTDPSRYARIEVPARRRIAFAWFAEADPGASIRNYRWVLDLRDLRDETERSNPETDWYHWSARSFNTNFAVIGPFEDDGVNHLFFIEAEDNNELRSLGIISFVAIFSTLKKPLLIVDDTRLLPDQRRPDGTYLNPTGSWPTSAELDTFFFARGGNQFLGYPNEPRLSPIGVFNGYDYDTIGTRGIPNGILPLSTIGDYAHVVWYTDAVAATFINSPLDNAAPITSLREMNSRGRASTMAIYLQQGGKVWLFGGGAAAATLLPWSRTNPPYEFTDTDLEVVPGRFMHDFVHWRTKIITPLTSQRGILFSPTNTIPGVRPLFQNPATAPGRGWAGQPSYARLPLTLDRRTAGSVDPADALPPFRTNGTFYTSNYFTEWISAPNFIREDTDNDPATPGEESKLDTLYFAAGGSAVPIARPTMTYYHGHENVPIVFLGLPLWYIRTAHELAIVDFVLQDLWGLIREPSSPLRAARAHRP